MSTRNTVYFPKSEGPFFYRRAIISTRDLDWWLAKGAFQDVEEAVKKGKTKVSKPVRKAVKSAKPKPK